MYLFQMIRLFNSQILIQKTESQKWTKNFLGNFNLCMKCLNMKLKSRVSEDSFMNKYNRTFEILVSIRQMYASKTHKVHSGKNV